MRTDFVTPDSLRWYEVLSDTVHDFYHLPEYVSFSAQQEGGDALAFLAEEGDYRLLLPLILRPINTWGDEGDRYYDVTCPYGYPGPLLAANNSRHDIEDFLDRALRSFKNELRCLDVVSVFSRFHPLLALPTEPFAEHGHLVQHGETVFIDLSLSSEEIWRQTRANHRRGINRAKREGHVVYIDEQWEEFDAFVDIYIETMRRVGAGAHYHFSRDYFTKLRQILGDRLHLCVVQIGGEIAGAGLFSEVCGIIEYHLGGTKEEHMMYYPTKAMFEFIRFWAKGRGNRLFHLGGGVGSERDSLFEFKAGFSKLRSPFLTWRVIADESVYSTLVECWESRYGVEANELQGYFPPYRKHN
jgi:hypothetical protein